MHVRFVRGVPPLMLLTLLVACSGAPPAADDAPPAPEASAGAEAAAQPAPLDAPEPEEPVAPDTGPVIHIRRDTWGVPHVFADSLADAAYALGYAQAEDRPEDLFRNIRFATGRMAEAFGEDHVDHDYQMRLIRNGARAEAYWPTAPEAVRAMGDAFVQGASAYFDAHPERLPAHALELHGWHTAAVGKAMVWRWPMGTVQSELGRAEEPAGASNAWVVAPDRSAAGGAMLLSDPHLTWEGLALFHEARVHTPETSLSGFFIVGSPLLGLGHNAHVAWAMTTGGPDTADVYEMRLNPEHPLQYAYDGEWRDATIEWIDIPVKDGVPVRRMAGYTHLGPVVAEPDLERGVAWVAASPYFEADRLPEQMYRMNTARDAAAFREALAMNQLMPQNVLYADLHGETGYARVGLTPVRPAGYDWSRPVPGDTSETAWDGVHPFEDLVQLVDPPQGYMQNCNVSPGVMMKDSPLKPDDYPDYIYNVSWDYQNPRGQRTLDLLTADDLMTLDAAQALAVDVYDVLAARWQGALTRALETAGPRDALADAAAALQAWDRAYAPDSRAATVMKFWRLACEDDEALARRIEQGEDLPEAEAGRLLDRLAQALRTLEERFGDPMPPWGDVHLVGRGGDFAPSPGAEYLSGPLDTETVFDVKYREREDGRYVAYNGTMALQLIVLKPDGITSYSLVSWGQSSDPASPHFMDQGRQLFSKRVLKPTWFDPESLAGHVASETALRRTPAP